MIVERIMTPVEVDMFCDKCKSGYMRSTGRVFMTYPPQHQHMCNNKTCGHVEAYSHTFPYVTYRRAE